MELRRIEGGLAPAPGAFSAPVLRGEADFQRETAAILADLIRRYTAGDGSSVREETAAQILGSIRYALDACAAAHHGRARLWEDIQRHGVRRVYDEGVEIVRNCVKETKTLYERIRAGRLAVPMAPYTDTLTVAIPAFFQTYDVEFGMQETTCSIDYPLAFDDITATGIFCIRQYLERLALETEFCRLLPPAVLVRTLYRFQAKFDFDIENAPVNLFGLLFDQLELSVLAGSKKTDLLITPGAFRRLAEDLGGLGRPGIKKRLNEAFRAMTAMLAMQSPALSAYLRRYQRAFAARLLAACSQGNLFAMALVEGEAPPAAASGFEDGERLSDAAFERLADNAAECGDAGEKARLIAGGVHSTRDLIDLMEADCLFGEEFGTLFECLDDIVLAVLGRTVFADELYQSRLRLSAPLLARYRQSAETEWQQRYAGFVADLAEDRRNRLQDLVNSLTVSGAKEF